MNDGHPRIDIAMQDGRWSLLGDAAALAERAIAAAVQQSGVKLRDGAEISILLCDDDFIRALNLQWRGKDAATNVLSFPVPGDPAAALSLGDIAVAYETSAREAEEEGKAFKDHVIHLFVHGFLHLIGYDHRDEAEAEAMERIERQVLAALDIADPYRSHLVGIAE